MNISRYDSGFRHKFLDCNSTQESILKSRRLNDLIRVFHEKSNTFDSKNVSTFFSKIAKISNYSNFNGYTVNKIKNAANILINKETLHGKCSPLPPNRSEKNEGRGSRG